MVAVEVGEEHAIHLRRVDAGAPHTADCAEAEVEDERLRPRLDYDATLPPSKTQRSGARAHNRDVHLGSLLSSFVLALREGGTYVATLQCGFRAPPSNT
jgi:hypothetical protein